VELLALEQPVTRANLIMLLLLELRESLIAPRLQAGRLLVSLTGVLGLPLDLVQRVLRQPRRLARLQRPILAHRVVVVVLVLMGTRPVLVPLAQQAGF
jgi:hypothetical protein